MQTIDFSNMKFGQIPSQDNPINDKHECILLTKNEEGNLILIHVNPDNKIGVFDVIGSFYNIKMALKIAELL